MGKTITIRLDEEMQRRLEELVRLSGRTRSEIIRDALERQLAVETFDELRCRLAPLAEARGWLTDEDVFEHIS